MRTKPVRLTLYCRGAISSRHRLKSTREAGAPASDAHPLEEVVVQSGGLAQDHQGKQEEHEEGRCRQPGRRQETQDAQQGGHRPSALGLA